jgi:alkylated DNA repair dioxygenase AlkB
MITGLTYLPGFLAIAEQESLISMIDSQPWLSDLKRRTQQYGYKYDYTRKVADASLYLGPIPAWLTPFTRYLAYDFFVKEPDQVIINEYLPGQGIGRHVDCVKCFGDTVASISLLSTVPMDFEQLGSSEMDSLLLSPGSLLILSGDARYNWMHSISARKADVIEGEEILRSRRISLTFRTMSL